MFLSVVLLLCQDLHFKGPSIADICEGLKRRGPDALNTETLYVTAVQSSSELQIDASVKNSITEPCIKIDFVGALLSLRGDRPVSQPLKDSVGNILVYNGAFISFSFRFLVISWFRYQKSTIFWCLMVMILFWSVKLVEQEKFLEVFKCNQAKMILCS